MMDPQLPQEYAAARHDQALEELKEFLRIPSVSTLPEHKPDMQRAAEWLAARMERAGLSSVAIMPTQGHPVVYAEHLGAGPDRPTVLVYGHYDVQPVDPLDLWVSDPFQPEVRGEDLFARGASDMKGQVMGSLLAAEAWLKTGSLPLNLKFLIEGEEEIGSPNLDPYLKANGARLGCDLCLNCDSGIISAEIPGIVYGLRGLAYFELQLQGPAGDQHSGTFGGAVENPANVLCRLIAGMHDSQGRVTLPGFYDQVMPLGDEERRLLAELPQDDAWWMRTSGAPALAGEAGYTASERAMARPTLDVNGLLSGFTGHGSKTVLPSKAMAKISMRLVPNQRPEQVAEGLRAYLEQHAPPTVTWELIPWAHAVPSILEQDSEAVRAATRAQEAVWGRPPMFNRQGGTVPVVGMIEEALGVKTLMMGFGLPDDNLHAPNEKFHLPNYRRGIQAYIRFLAEYAA
jgi:acetylornithine deacetylase/succinyl-diaminopimelate desuccinylase-like protein